MPALSSPSAVSVTCTNHLSPSQAAAAWQTLVRDVLLPCAIQSAAPSASHLILDNLVATATMGNEIK